MPDAHRLAKMYLVNLVTQIKKKKKKTKEMKIELSAYKK